MSIIYPSLFSLDEQNRPGVYNLLLIYSLIKDVTVERAAEAFKVKNETFLKEKNTSYFKKELTEEIINFLNPIQLKYKEYIKNKEYLMDVIIYIII